MSTHEPVGFTPADIKFFLLLALMLGVNLVIEIVIAKNNAQVVVAIVLNVVTMLSCPAGVYAYRRFKQRI